MRIDTVGTACTACTACAKACPVGCISFKSDKVGFSYPAIEEDKCIHCNKCARVCHAVDFGTAGDERTCYYGYTMDENVRKNSSSGGAFYHLAQSVLSKDGNVYGAAFDNEKRLLKHTSSDQVGLSALQKSKYLESEMGNVLRDVQKDIDAGRSVLFCGTPCQCSGVRRAIDDPKGNLLLCDFICHGVPTQKYFQEHLQYLFGDEELQKVDFRNKDLGWSAKRMYIKTRTKSRTVPYALDSFYYGFMSKNAFLRDCCYECKFRETRFSDITLADFWGYRAFDPSLNDEKGLSLLIANTKKGRSAIQAMRGFNLYPLENKYAEYAFSKRDYSQAYEKKKAFVAMHEQVGFEKAARNLYMQDYAVRLFKYKVKKFLGIDRV